MQSETGFSSSHQLKSYVASKSRLKLAARAVLSADAGLLVLCSFCVVVHFFRLVNACFCCDRFSFFHTKSQEISLGNVTEMTYFVSSGT